jgi:hypothetical protein
MEQKVHDSTNAPPRFWSILISISPQRINGRIVAEHALWNNRWIVPSEPLNPGRCSKKETPLSDSDKDNNRGSARVRV